MRDKDEPKAAGLKFSINGGRVERDDRDTTIRIFDLEPYITYTIELDRNSFDNISWQIKKQTINVIVDPDQFKLIEIPIAIVGEVSGTVYLSENDGKKGQGRIIGHFTAKMIQVLLRARLRSRMVISIILVCRLVRISSKLMRLSCTN